MDHAWITPNGNIVIITISQSVGLDSGVWKDLTEMVIPDWIDGGFGMEWAREPYISVSKKPVCQVLNQYGQKCTIQLESLQNEAEVEARFKPRRYTMVYVPELSTFNSRSTFDTWTECLRTIGLPASAHQFLADSNPPTDECWWMHDLWWDLVEMSEEDVDADVLARFFPALAEEEPEIAWAAFWALKKDLARIDIAIEDNPFADPAHVATLKAKYAHNDELYRRYIKGECVRTTEGSIFAKVFRPAFHVVGEVKTIKNKDPEILVPEEGCMELYTGWDPGVTNSSAHIAEKHYRMEEVIKDGKKIGDRKVPILKYIDELIIVNEPHSLDEFVLEFMKRMEFWEEWLGRPGKVIWHHWSDRSVLDMKSPESDKYFHQIIYEASARYLKDGYYGEDGEYHEFHIGAPILLETAPRGPGSVQQRIDLFQKLMFDERVWFSADKCPMLIQAIKSVKKGTNSVQVIQKGTPHKHSIDSATYLACAELRDELARAVIRNLVATRKKSEGTLVSVPY